MCRWVIRWLLLAAVLLVPALPAFGQERLAPARGVLLVAGEGIADPRFRETVILLLRYGPEGVVGVVLNRPTALPLESALPEPSLAGRHDPIHYGGPVDPLLLLVLLRSDRPPQKSEPVAADLHLTGLPQVVDRLNPPAGKEEPFRVFAGYAGWTSTQLADEIGRGDWYVVPFDAGAVFTEDPAGLWQRLRKGRELWI